MQKTILLIGGSRVLHEYIEPLKRAGVHVKTQENFDKALEEIHTIHPDIIGMILPGFFDTVTRFVTHIRALPDYKTVPIIYIGGMIEGADDTILRRYGVKTLTLGPVQTSEVARFILHQLSL